MTPPLTPPLPLPHSPGLRRHDAQLRGRAAGRQLLPGVNWGRWSDGRAAQKWEGGQECRRGGPSLLEQFLVMAVTLARLLASVSHPGRRACWQGRLQLELQILHPTQDAAPSPTIPIISALPPSAQVRDATHDSTAGLGSSSFLSHIILNGEFPDFTKGWYENVGLPILVRGRRGEQAARQTIMFFSQQPDPLPYLHPTTHLLATHLSDAPSRLVTSL